MVKFVKKNLKCILILIRDIKKIITMILPIAISFVFILHFRWLKIKGIDKTFYIPIMLFSNHLKYNIWLKWKLGQCNSNFIISNVGFFKNFHKSSTDRRLSWPGPAQWVQLLVRESLIVTFGEKASYQTFLSEILG